MRCDNRITIQGTVEQVMAILAPVERWSLILPGYPWVRFIGRHGQGTFVQMHARLNGLPLAWTAEHIVFADEGRIIHRHLRGPTTGLWSECRLTAAGERVEVMLTHDWQPGWPLIGSLVAALVCRWLVQPLSQRTLEAVAQRVESGQAEALRRLEVARRQSGGFRRRYGP